MWAWDHRFDFSWGLIDLTVDLFCIMVGVAIGERDLVLHVPFITIGIEWYPPE